MNERSAGGRSASAKIAETGHAGTHAAQSMQAPGSMNAMRSTPSSAWMHCTGQTSTHIRLSSPTQREVV